jgi:hypothetical protein
MRAFGAMLNVRIAIRGSKTESKVGDILDIFPASHYGVLSATRLPTLAWEKRSRAHILGVERQALSLGGLHTWTRIHYVEPEYIICCPSHF